MLASPWMEWRMKVRPFGLHWGWHLSQASWADLDIHPWEEGYSRCGQSRAKARRQGKCCSEPGLGSRETGLWGWAVFCRELQRSCFTRSSPLSSKLFSSRKAVLGHSFSS